jgi:hypothetical protein
MLPLKLIGSTSMAVSATDVMLPVLVMPPAKVATSMSMPSSWADMLPVLVMPPEKVE